ncbi:MAG: Spy/CpxP family protein refolding chaperone [bacterium]|nr:Spy/CpxP family protein refolding chaperone [bacterium]
MDRQRFDGIGALALALLVIALAAAPALAQPNLPRGAGRAAALAATGSPDDVDLDGAGFGRGGRFGEHLARRLDLDDVQREAIAKIHEAGRERDLPLRKEIRRLRHELKGEMMKDVPSEKAVRELTARIGQARTSLQAGRLGDQLAVRAQLTPQQRDRLLAMGGPGDGPRGGRHGGRHGGWNRPGRGAPDCDGDGPRRGGQGRRGPCGQPDAD